MRLDPQRTFRREHPEELAHFLGPLPQGEEGPPPLVTFAVAHLLFEGLALAARPVAR